MRKHLCPILCCLLAALGLASCGKGGLLGGKFAATSGGTGTATWTDLGDPAGYAEAQALRTLLLNGGSAVDYLNSGGQLAKLANAYYMFAATNDIELNRINIGIANAHLTPALVASIQAQLGCAYFEPYYLGHQTTYHRAIFSTPRTAAQLYALAKTVLDTWPLEVSYAGANTIGGLADSSNDPQMQYKNLKCWAPFASSATELWPYTKGASVKIVVIDTGMDPEYHVDMNPGNGAIHELPDREDPNDPNSPELIDNTTVLQTDPLRFDPSYETPLDQPGHGTTVSSMIAARGNNSMGLSGVAPLATVIPIKAHSQDPNSPIRMDITAAIGTVRQAHALDPSIKLVNISLYTLLSAEPYPDVPLQTALQDLRTDGILPCVSAGNANFYQNPGNFPEAFSIQQADYINDPVLLWKDWKPEEGYTDGFHQPITSWTDLWAPGKGVALCNSLPGPANDLYTSSSGSSYASPCAAAACALLWDLNPGLNANQVEQQIKNMALPYLQYSDPAEPAGVKYRLDLGNLHPFVNSYNNQTHLSTTAVGLPGGGLLIAHRRAIDEFGYPGLLPLFTRYQNNQWLSEVPPAGPEPWHALLAMTATDGQRISTLLMTEDYNVYECIRETNGIWGMPVYRFHWPAGNFVTSYARSLHTFSQGGYLVYRDLYNSGIITFDTGLQFPLGEWQPGLVAYAPDSGAFMLLAQTATQWKLFHRQGSLFDSIIAIDRIPYRFATVGTVGDWTGYCMVDTTNYSDGMYYLLRPAYGGARAGGFGPHEFAHRNFQTLPASSGVEYKRLQLTGNSLGDPFIVLSGTTNVGQVQKYFAEGYRLDWPDPGASENAFHSRESMITLGALFGETFNYNFTYAVDGRDKLYGLCLTGMTVPGQTRFSLVKSLAAAPSL